MGNPEKPNIEPERLEELEETELEKTTPYPEDLGERKEEKLYVDIAGERLEKALDKIGEVMGKGAEKLPQKQERAVEDAVFKAFDKIGEGISKAGEKLPQRQEKAVEDAVWKAFDKMGDWTAKGVIGAEKGIRKGVRELIKIGKSPRLELIKEKWKEKWQEKIKKAKPKEKKEKLEKTFGWRRKLVEKIFRKRKEEGPKGTAEMAAAEAEELKKAQEAAEKAFEGPSVAEKEEGEKQEGEK